MIFKFNFSCVIRIRVVLMVAKIGTRHILSGVAGAVGGLLAGKYINSPDVTFQEATLPTKNLVQPIQVTGRAAKILAFGAPKVPTQGPIVYTNHVLEYDSARKVPRWVAEHLTKDSVEQNVANRKGVQFSRDPTVPALFSSDNSDYWGSGWSRGHMAPAGDNKHCQQSMKDTFYLTNIVPQDIDNNGGYWNRLEVWCRNLTKQYSNVWVISGPLWLPDISLNGEQIKVVDNSGDNAKRKKKSEVRKVEYSVLGENFVAVPTHLFKVVLVTDPKLEKPLLSTFIVPNVPIADKHLGQFAVSLENLERHVGVVFHPELDRSNVGDLCVDSGCQLEDYKKFMQFFWARRLKTPWNINNLERDWAEIVAKGDANEELEKIYCESKDMLLKKQELKSQKSDSVAVAA